MLPRTSQIENIRVKIASYSSVVQLGDSCIINSFSRALAVQRQADTFYGNEGNFGIHRVFSELIPLPIITENLTIRQHYLNPVIKVKNIDIIGVSSASLLHVGNTQHVSVEVRVKHVRQLLPRDEEPDTSLMIGDRKK